MTTDDLTESIEAEATADRAHAIDLMDAIAVLNDQLRPLEAAKKRAVDELKQWMALNRETELHDGERGIVARIQTRKGTPTYDLISLVARGDEAALYDAAVAGMVRIDHMALDRLRKGAGASWADVVHRYQQPAGETEALIVEVQK